MSIPFKPDNQPLLGRVIVVTRAKHQAVELIALLRAAGASTLHYPAIAIKSPADAGPLDMALKQAKSYDWLLVTSANTVVALSERLTELALPPNALEGPRVAAVGPATARAVQEQLGLAVDAMPVDEDYDASRLAAVLGSLSERRVLLPQSALAPADLADALRSQGAIVEAVTAYVTVIGAGGDDVPAALINRSVDAVTFTSASTVDFTLQRLRDDAGMPAKVLDKTLLACIGQATALALQAHGLQPDLVAKPSTVHSLVDALRHHAWHIQTLRVSHP